MIPWFGQTQTHIEERIGDLVRPAINQAMRVASGNGIGVKTGDDARLIRTNLVN